MTSLDTVRKVPRGALIVFEGGDRCGKTTQCSKLVERLRSQGVDAVMWRFPDRSTSIGAAINAYLAEQSHLDDAVVHMLFVANRLEKREEMLRLLAGGTTLVLDRYSYSGVAYTAAKGLPHLSIEYCKSVEVLLPAADLVLHMTMTAEATAARGGYGQERYEKVEFQKKAMEAFEALRDERWAVIDASGTIEDIHQQVVAVTEPVVRQALAGRALGRLWDYQPMELPGTGPDADAMAALGQGGDADDTVVHLLFTANRFEKRKEMLRLLAGGTTLVLDRYSYSGVAYTAAKGLPHLDGSYCRSVEVGLPAADLVVLMDLPPERAAARGGFGRERYEKLDMQRKVALQYEALKDGRWLTLDATAPPELIHQQVMAAVSPVVDRAAGGAPLGRLWDYKPLELPDVMDDAAAAAAGVAAGNGASAGAAH
ncbi:hypothetical protein PLESTB_000442000 [Pleodorina starrii]|uniref:Thymidylate kinase n=1 Tax=Pleodorina starrii TaxID=330485 RepID=A0A9W6EZA9_9CHLO|nr:hypothetical protein PLESTB_000442000 [Pleodorina starrii]